MGAQYDWLTLSSENIQKWRLLRAWVVGRIRLARSRRLLGHTKTLFGRVYFRPFGPRGCRETRDWHVCWKEGAGKLGPADAFGIPGVLADVLPTTFKRLVVAAGRSLCEQRHGELDCKWADPPWVDASAAIPWMVRSDTAWFNCLMWMS